MAALQEGELLVQPALAATLERYARGGAAAFYSALRPKRSSIAWWKPIAARATSSATAISRSTTLPDTRLGAGRSSVGSAAIR
ncbi:MAG: hypothetical protein R3F17_06120 [Planctomycetota bacterium]